MWKYSKNGEFFTNSAYQLANQGETSNTPFQGQWIWKLDILPKIANFLWLCFHDSIPVKDVLVARGINCDRVCPLYNCQDETFVPLLRDCEVAHKFWRKLEVPLSQINSFIGSLENWIKTNCLSIVGYKSSIPWCTLFSFCYLVPLEE